MPTNMSSSTYIDIEKLLETNDHDLKQFVLARLATHNLVPFLEVGRVVGLHLQFNVISRYFQGIPEAGLMLSLINIKDGTEKTDFSTLSFYVNNCDLSVYFRYSLKSSVFGSDRRTIETMPFLERGDALLYTSLKTALGIVIDTWVYGLVVSESGVLVT